METIDLGFDLGMDDTSFLNRMCEGGVSGESCRDCSFDDHTDYESIKIDITNVSDEVAEIIKYINSI